MILNITFIIIKDSNRLLKKDIASIFDIADIVSLIVLLSIDNVLFIDISHVLLYNLSFYNKYFSLYENTNKI